MTKMTTRLLPALLVAAFAGSVSAAGLQAWEQSASGIGVSHAGSAAIADNAGTIYYNPAGMTLLPGRHVSLGMAGVRPNIEFRDGSGNAGQWTTLPNAYLSWQVADRWFAGLGMSSPFRLATEYDRGWAGSAIALKSDIKSANFNPSLAYRLGDKVSLGLGIDYQRLDVELTSATPGARFRADDSAWGWNAGALFTLSPAMRVGVSYRSAMNHSLKDGSVSEGLKLPDVFILSVWQQLSERWEAMGDLSYTNWSTVRGFRPAGAAAPFAYKDSWRFAWGAAYKASDTWKARFGIGYERSPAADGDASIRLPEDHRLSLSVGGQWKPARNAAVDFGYAYQYQRDPSADQAGLRGRYDTGGHVLGIQYSQGF